MNTGLHLNLRRLALSVGEKLARLARHRACEREFDALYGVLYEMAHDLDQAAAFAARHTVEAFGHQWAAIPSGKFMLSDPEFKRTVDDIICGQEILIDRAWFPGKRALDAGCGGGRWSYGLAKLGAQVTAVDTNRSALEATAKGLRELSASAEFVQSDLDSLEQKRPPESFDLVWSWGVLHHCVSFTGALKSLTALLRPGGLLFVYLYGRESIGMTEDVKLFRERMQYNFLNTPEAKQRFLVNKAIRRRLDVHHAHDIYAPLINRRFTFDEVKGYLNSLGYSNIERTVDHTELWIRAVKGPDNSIIQRYGLPKKQPPYWFQR